MHLSNSSSLALLDAGQDETRSLALHVNRLLVLTSAKVAILEDVGKRVGLVLGIAASALARLLARSRALRADSSPRAACGHARVAVFHLTSEAAGATASRVRLVVGDGSGRVLGRFGNRAHAASRAASSLAALKAGSHQIVDCGAASASGKVLAALVFGSWLRLELVKGRRTARLTNRVLTSTTLARSIAASQWSHGESGSLGASRLGSISTNSRSQEAVNGSQGRSLLVAAAESIG